MLNSLVDNLGTAYYAVFDDLTYKEATSLESASQFKPLPLFLIKKTNIGKTYSFFNSDFFAHSSYSFYSLEFLNIIIEESGWKLTQIEEAQNRSRQVLYYISDPTGEIKKISNYDFNKSNWNDYFQIRGICKVIAFIKKISKYPGWSYYELESENSKLKL